MKNILLITIRNEISEMYTAELKKIFDGYSNIMSYSFENSESKPFNKLYLKSMDLVLITSTNVFSLIRNHIVENTPIVYVHFTFMQDKIDLMKAYPRDTNAYIGFKAYSASYQTVSLLYELGLNNLNLKVYDPTYTNTDDIDIGIVCDNSNIFPKEVKNILSLGKRKIAFMTIMDIATSISIMDDNLENRIYSYCNGMAVHDNCLSYFYGKSSNVKVQLQTIIDCIDDAFIMLNHNYVILDHNTQLLNLFRINRNIINTNIANSPEFANVYEKILPSGEFKNNLIMIGNNQKKILLSKKIIKDRERKHTIYILIIKDITNVINLESTLRKQLAKKGHVTKYNFDNVKGHSNAIINCIEKAKKIAKIDKPTLITGESGGGKELFAQSIHNNSTRSKFPFVAINCAALSSTLLESELFGYEEGSFTGAKKGGKTGLFETAHTGTLFLDEIGEMSLETQAKLLRVLEEKEVMKVGSNEIVPIDVRIIAATNRNLKKQVDDGNFRLDLFYRLNTVMLRIPPLRERTSDIVDLCNFFLTEEIHTQKKFGKEVIDFMLSYPWPGNIRELKNCVEYMANISDEFITIEHLPEYMLSYDQELPRVSPQETSITGEKTSLHEHNAAIRILELLMDKSIGRRKLIEMLHENSINISEYRLRSILEALNQKGYISFSKGRAGSVITIAGRNALLSGQTLL